MLKFISLPNNSEIMLPPRKYPSKPPKTEIKIDLNFFDNHGSGNVPKATPYATPN